MTFASIHLDCRWSALVHSICTGGQVRGKQRVWTWERTRRTVQNWGWGSRNVSEQEWGPCSESTPLIAKCVINWEKPSGLEALVNTRPSFYLVMVLGLSFCHGLHLPTQLLCGRALHRLCISSACVIVKWPDGMSPWAPVFGLPLGIFLGHKKLKGEHFRAEVHCLKNLLGLLWTCMGRQSCRTHYFIYPRWSHFFINRWVVHSLSFCIVLFFFLDTRSPGWS